MADHGHLTIIFTLIIFTCTSRPIGTRIYGDLVYKFKKIMGRTDFSDRFQKIIIRHKRIGYDLNVMRSLHS